MRRRKKNLPTRRRRALRWITALVLVVMVGHLTGVYCLTPERALRKAEQEHFCGRTEWLCRLPEIPEASRERDLRLSGGEHALVLGEYVFTWSRGWRTLGSLVLEREIERPFSANLYDGLIAVGTGNYTRYFYVYGALESPDTAQLEIVLDAREGGYDQTVRLTEADYITTEDGERFFLCALEPEENLYSYACYITAFDAEGAELGTLQAAGIPRWE